MTKSSPPPEPGATQPSEDDAPEDQATELWSPVAKNLFAEEFKRQRAAGEKKDAAQREAIERKDFTDGETTEPDLTRPKRPEGHDTDPGPPAFVQAHGEAAAETDPGPEDEGDTLEVFPGKKRRERKRKKEKRARKQEAGRGSSPGPEEPRGGPASAAVAGEISVQAGAPLKKPAGRPRRPEPEEPATDPENLRDTLDEPPDEAVLAAARRGSSSPENLVKIPGPPPASEARKPSPSPITPDSGATLLIEGRRERVKASHECRICGRKVNAPKPRRFRGATGGRAAFTCDHCENIFCAAHVVRVSGLVETLFRGGRFRCLLCQSALTDEK